MMFLKKKRKRKENTYEENRVKTPLSSAIPLNKRFQVHESELSVAVDARREGGGALGIAVESRRHRDVVTDTRPAVITSPLSSHSSRHVLQLRRNELLVANRLLHSVARDLGTTLVIKAIGAWNHVSRRVVAEQCKERAEYACMAFVHGYCDRNGRVVQKLSIRAGGLEDLSPGRKPDARNQWLTAIAEKPLINSENNLQACSGETPWYNVSQPAYSQMARIWNSLCETLKTITARRPRVREPSGLSARRLSGCGGGRKEGRTREAVEVEVARPLLPRQGCGSLDTRPGLPGRTTHIHPRPPRMWVRLSRKASASSPPLPRHPTPSPLERAAGQSLQVLLLPLFHFPYATPNLEDVAALRQSSAAGANESWRSTYRRPAYAARVLSSTSAPPPYSPPPLAIQEQVAVAERLECSPPIKVKRVQSPAGLLPDFRMWESCRTIPLVDGFSRGSPALSFRRCSVLTSITLINSQYLAPKPPKSIHSPLGLYYDLHAKQVEKYCTVTIHSLFDWAYQNQVTPTLNFRDWLADTPQTSTTSGDHVRRMYGGAAVAEWLACSPPTMANRVQSPAGLLRIFATGECAGWTMQLVGGFSRGSPVSPILAFRRNFILSSFHTHRLSRPRSSNRDRSRQMTQFRRTALQQMIEMYATRNRRIFLSPEICTHNVTWPTHVVLWAKISANGRIRRLQVTLTRNTGYLATYHKKPPCFVYSLSLGVCISARSHGTLSLLRPIKEKYLNETKHVSRRADNAVIRDTCAGGPFPSALSLEAPSRTVGFTHQFHTLLSIHGSNTSPAVVPQSPVVVHNSLHSRTLGQAAYIKDCRALGCDSIYSVLGCHLESSPTRVMRHGRLRRSQSHQNILASSPSSATARWAAVHYSQKWESGGRECIVPRRGEGEWVSYHGLGQLSGRQLQHLTILLIKNEVCRISRFPHALVFRRLLRAHLASPSSALISLRNSTLGSVFRNVDLSLKLYRYDSQRKQLSGNQHPEIRKFLEQEQRLS
ncbi:hypothetical protein PR048_024940 [Dryococelus australis]|uniref:Uncharacterized protein n=1 Tax=Dryococelus australis TaxID=614101 RepID=A0ABQ9GPZ3_9NEOP|nr:hypothetical protein PR048_024940 [Dryococelus australis]